MPTWTDLETRFNEVAKQLHAARLDYQGGAAGEYWRIAASFDRHAASRFEITSRLAGRKLLVDAGAEELLHTDLQESPDDATRWYRAMKLLSGHFEHGFVGFQTNDDGSHAGTIVTGQIYSPANVASTLCLEMSAMSNEPPVPPGTLTINVSGGNSRVNVGSNDSSTNTYFANTSTVFQDLQSVVSTQVPAEFRSELLSRIEQMEKSVGRPSFVTRYTEFIQSAANHISVLAPLLPALSALLP